MVEHDEGEGDIAKIDDRPTDILCHTRYGVDQQLAATDEHRMYQPSTRRIHPGSILIITSAEPVDDVIRIVATNFSDSHQA